MAVTPFFWLHVKKSGGQTVRDILGTHYVQTDRARPTPFVALPKAQWNDALNNFRLPLGPYDYRRTLFARDFLYGAEEFAGRYAFAVVRNPYDRIVSAYTFLTRGSTKWHAYRLLGRRRAFAEFLTRLPAKWNAPNKAGNRRVATHTAPVMPDVTDDDGEILLDRLFRLERFGDELPELAEALGIEIPELSHRNRTAQRRDYRSYYNRETRRLVETHFGDDIQRLGYEY